MKKKDEFPKRNEMVMLKGNTLSNYAHKTLDYIYKNALKVYENKRDGGIFELNIFNLKKEIGMNGKAHKKIIKELESIQNLIFETYDDKYYSSFPILAGFELKENGILEVAFSPFFIREMMFNTENIYYHMSNIIEYKHLKSKYSKRILDLYKRYNGSIPRLEAKKFKGLMQYSENYRNYHIELKVLKQAKKDLLENNNMDLTWEIEKMGTKWKYIQLNIVELIDINEEKLEFSDKLEKAIEKARKSHFIDAIYSHKAMQKIVSTYDEKDILKALREATKYNSEILNFSKFLISKIKDIQNSKKGKTPKEAEKIETPKKLTELEIQKGEVAKLLIKSKQTKLFEELEKIENLENLEKFKLTYHEIVTIKLKK